MRNFFEKRNQFSDFEAAAQFMLSDDFNDAVEAMQRVQLAREEGKVGGTLVLTPARAIDEDLARVRAENPFVEILPICDSSNILVFTAVNQVTTVNIPDMAKFCCLIASSTEPQAYANFTFDGLMPSSLVSDVTGDAPMILPLQLQRIICCVNKRTITVSRRGSAGGTMVVGLEFYF